MMFRVRIPGGVPDFDASEALASRSGIATGSSGVFFYNLGCGQYRAGIAQWQSATLPASRREFDPRCPPHGFPSSNGEDGGLSSRRCRFDSGRECHVTRGSSSTDRALALQAKGAGSNPAFSTISL